ncbi:MAG: hypothetical protein GC159_19735 [Phycisphaera sp.]|nr:hypothetical protein [Phycisphaera sp.]
MFIVWGTKHKTRDAGVVAERCDVCMAPQPFVVTDHYEAGHIYWISLTQGTYKISSMKCPSCGNELICNKDDYDQVLARDIAARLPIHELIERTNHRLGQSMRMRENLEAMASQQAQAPPRAPGSPPPLPGARPTTGGPDPRFALAVAKLRDFDDSDTSRELMARLSQWQTLDTDLREKLLTEVDEFVDSSMRINQTIGFIRTIANSYPDSAGCLSGFFVFLVPMALFFIPALQSWLWGPIVVIAAFVAGFVVMQKVSARRIRAWTINKLIPEADADQIDYTLFVGVLLGVNTSDQAIDQHVRNLATGVKNFLGVLIEQGRIEGEGADAPATPAKSDPKRPPTPPGKDGGRGPISER